MGDEPKPAPKGMQEQIDALVERLTVDRADTDANLADIAHLQKAGQVNRTDIDRLQIGAEVDRHLLAELQTDGLVRAEHAAQLETALRSARVIGAAIGIVMATRHCTQEEAFEILSQVSQNSNQKLRNVADDIVRAGMLP